MELHFTWCTFPQIDTAVFWGEFKHLNNPEAWWMTNTTRKLNVQKEILASPHYQGCSQDASRVQRRHLQPSLLSPWFWTSAWGCGLLLFVYAIQGKKFHQMAPKAKFLKLDVADQAHWGQYGSAKSQLLTHIDNVWFCSTNVGGKHLVLVSLEMGRSQAMAPWGSWGREHTGEDTHREVTAWGRVLAHRSTSGSHGRGKQHFFKH